MRRPFLVLLLVPMLTLAACGSDSGEGDAASSRAEDKVTVKKAVAAFEADLKDDGYKRSADSSSDDSSDDDLHFTGADCKDLEAAFGSDDLPGSEVSADSDSFTDGDFDGSNTETDVEGSAAIIADQKKVDSVFKALRDSEVEGCLEKAVNEEFKKSADGEQVTVGAVDVDVQDIDGVGDDAIDVRITATVDVAVLKFPFVIDLTLAKDGDHAASVLVTTLGDKEPGAKAKGLLESLLGHIDEAA